MPDVYRQAASMLLVRHVPSRGHEKEPLQFLLLHKPRKRDAWQLPQGGMEAGETVEQAAVRELQEEAGITQVKMLQTSDIVYQYEFPQSYRRFRPDNIRGQRIGFVIAQTSPETPVQVDDKEIDQYQWISLSELGHYVRRPEYVTIVRKLYDEALTLVPR